MQQSQVDSNIIQSTTIKTIKELKKLGESRHLDAEDHNESTVSGKGTPEEEKCRTSYVKLKLTKKVSLNYTKPDSQRQIEMKQEEQGYRTNTFKRPPQRYTTLKPTSKVQPSKTQPQQPEQADLNLAMNLILSKSKQVREQLEQMQLTQTQINKFIRDDRLFQLSFQSMLDKLVANGKLTSNLANIQKPTLTQIEQFAVAHARRCLQKADISMQYLEKKKSIDSIFTKYNKELTNRENNMIVF